MGPAWARETSKKESNKGNLTGALCTTFTLVGIGEQTNKKA
jgi:hypothetical protein